MWRIYFKQKGRKYLMFFKLLESSHPVLRKSRITRDNPRMIFSLNIGAYADNIVFNCDNESHISIKIK